MWWAVTSEVNIPEANNLTHMLSMTNARCQYSTTGNSFQFNGSIKKITWSHLKAF